jgi:hypothetical protein
MPKQVDDECRQSIVLTLGPAIFDGDVSASLFSHWYITGIPLFVLTPNI